MFDKMNSNLIRLCLIKKNRKQKIDLLYVWSKEKNKIK